MRGAELWPAVAALQAAARDRQRHDSCLEALVSVLRLYSLGNSPGITRRRALEANCSLQELPWRLSCQLHSRFRVEGSSSARCEWQRWQLIARFRPSLAPQLYVECRRRARTPARGPASGPAPAARNRTAVSYAARPSTGSG